MASRMTWQCDKCNRQEAQVGAISLPVGWRRMQVEGPGVPPQVIDFCTPCFAAVQVAIFGPTGTQTSA